MSPEEIQRAKDKVTKFRAGKAKPVNTQAAIPTQKEPPK